MAKLNDVPAHFLPYKNRKCIFCEEEITFGAFWSSYTTGICVGSCCKDRLIHMYKDISLEENCDRIGSFIYDIKKDIQKCYSKTIDNMIEREKQKIKESTSKIKDYECKKDYECEIEFDISCIDGE